MSTITINPKRTGGDLTIRIECVTPQITAGIVYRFNSDGSFDREAGTYTSDNPDVKLGAVTGIDGKQFSIEGLVKAVGDNPPSPYKIVVTTNQDGNELSRQVPDDHGSGTIGDEDVRYNYQFNINAV